MDRKELLSMAVELSQHDQKLTPKEGEFVEEMIVRLRSREDLERAEEKRIERLYEKYLGDGEDPQDEDDVDPDDVDEDDFV